MTSRVPFLRQPSRPVGVWISRREMASFALRGKFCGILYLPYTEDITQDASGRGRARVIRARAHRRGGASVRGHLSLAAHDLVVRVNLVLADEGRMTDEHLVDENAEGPPEHAP